MNDLDNFHRTLFSTPFCPTCATLYSADCYDPVDDRARCANCGTAYRIPDDFRPLHPEDAIEYGFLETPQSVALDQFRIDARRISEATMRETRGGTYEMYERRFTDAVEPYIEDLDPAVHDRAIGIARDLGYVEDPEAMAVGFGPGLCSISGIEEDYCHCGRHP